MPTTVSLPQPVPKRPHIQWNSKQLCPSGTDLLARMWQLYPNASFATWIIEVFDPLRRLYYIGDYRQSEAEEAFKLDPRTLQAMLLAVDLPWYYRPLSQP